MATSPLKLYLDPACPFCMKVVRFADQAGIELEHREISLWADSPTKQELIELGGKSQVPFLVDEETGAQMYESDDIIAYLASKQAETASA
jgi:glutathione S-transferase